MTATATEAIPSGALDDEQVHEWRPSVQGWATRGGILAAILGAILWATAVVPQYWADRISLAAIFAIIGLSLNIVLGYIGQVSLGHHGFVGIAAFVAAYYVTDKAGCVEGDCALTAFGVATLLAIASGALSAGLLGLVALRIKGLYLALITLAYGFMAETSIFELPALTGGGAGKPAPRPAGFTTDRAFAFLCFGFLALVIFVDWRMLKSKVGRAILSIKSSEPVAASYGINVTAYKVLAFVLSGAFAGLAGSLFAFRATNVVANNFVFSQALLWVLMVVVGGLGSRVGVVVGSAFFALFPFLLELALGSGAEEGIAGRPIDYYTLVVGPFLALLTLVQFPGGIAEQISPITRWLGGKRFTMHPEGHGKKHADSHKSLLGRLGLEKKSQDAGELAALATVVNGAPVTNEVGSDEEAAAPDETDVPEPVSVASGGGRGKKAVDPPDVWGNLTNKGKS